jgi:hypothetical protein
MKALPAGETIDQLDTGDLDQPMPLEGIKPGRLGIEHDLAHQRSSRPMSERITAAWAL